MATKKKRFMLTIPDDIETDAANVKREMFYDKSYAEMYRQLIRLGLDCIKSKEPPKGKEGERAS